jgi:hypothetical protein
VAVAPPPVRESPRPTIARKEPRPGRAETPSPEPRESARAEETGDEFARAFGGAARTARSEEPRPEPTRKKEVYVPPAPGAGSDVKDSLGQSDILEVVVANKAGLARCAEDQRLKEPGTSGRLVMRWQILTSGKVSQVTVVSEEFRSTSMASCVGKLIKGLTFPRHRQQGEPVTFPFKF